MPIREHPYWSKSLQISIVLFPTYVKVDFLSWIFLVMHAIFSVYDISGLLLSYKLYFLLPEQEKDLFLHKCLECLQMERPRFSFSSDAQKAATVCKNLRKCHYADCFSCTLQTLYNSLFVTCICRFIVESCRIFNSYFFKRGGCTAFKVIHASTICREQLLIN